MMNTYGVGIVLSSDVIDNVSDVLFHVFGSSYRILKFVILGILLVRIFVELCGPYSQRGKSQSNLIRSSQLFCAGFDFVLVVVLNFH